MKVFIVDDEMITIRMLKNIILWEDFGLEIIGYANDGQQAYNMILNEKPDIIISDIKMNNMSGLELVEKVQSIYKDVKFILMSAYADFGYVKEAMRLGCSDYILKPIDELELEKTLRKVIEQIRGIQNEKKVIDNSEKQLRLLNLYKYMKFGNNINKVLKNVNEFEIKFDKFALILVQQNNTSMDEYTHTNSIELIQEKYINSVLEDIIKAKKNKNFICFEYEEDAWLLLIEDVDTKEIVSISQYIIDNFMENLNLNVLICFSPIGKNLEDMPLLYDQIKSLSKYSFYIGEEKILGYNYNCDGNEIDKLRYIGLIREAEQSLQNNNIEHLKEIVNGAFELTREFNPNILENIYEFCYRILIVVNKMLKNDYKTIKYEELQKYSSLKELKKFVINSIEKLDINSIENTTKKYSKPVEQTLKIIQRDYDKNISLDDISQSIAVSKNYFCYLFKREVGVSLWNYLTQVRLQQAKKLLKETEMKTYEIAFKVGYDNPSYFSKIFKKIEHMTPNEYREKII